MVGLGFDSKDAQFQFLSSLKNRRFLELQKITGAYQGEGKLNRNQLLDAFHFWCAEFNSCAFFLTLDFKLIRMLNSARVKHASPTLAVRPSELMQKLG